MLIVWLRVWIASIGVPAAMRPIAGNGAHRPAAFVLGSRAHTAQIAFDDARREAARARSRHAVRDQFRRLDHFDGARNSADAG